MKNLNTTSTIVLKIRVHFCKKSVFLPQKNKPKPVNFFKTDQRYLNFLKTLNLPWFSFVFVFQALEYFSVPEAIFPLPKTRHNTPIHKRAKILDFGRRSDLK